MKQKNHKNVTLETLASMVSNGFLDMESKMDKRFKILEDGQDQIKLRLDNVAYRFELVELQRRVMHLEKKAGVNYRKKN